MKNTTLGRARRALVPITLAVAAALLASARGQGLQISGPKISQRALVAKVLALGAEVHAPDVIKSADKLPNDNAPIKAINFTTNVTVDAIAAIAGGNVEELSLRGPTAVRLTLEAWGKLAASATLRKVDLTGHPKPGFLGALSKVQGLEEINMSLDNGPAQRETDVATLGALPNLRYLRLAKIPVTGTAFAKWPVRPALTNLLIPDSGTFDEGGLQALLHAAPELSELSVGAIAMTDAKIKILGQFTALKTLRVPRETSDSVMSKLQAALPKAKVELRKDSRY